MKRIFFLTCFLGLAIPVFAQELNFETIDQYLAKTQKQWDVTSMSVGIVKDGELVFHKGYGALDGQSKPPDEHTLYAIASNSKAFTTAIIAMLVQEGKLDWNDKVVDYLPYFEIYDKDISQLVTIKDLLTHRVGLGTFSGDAMWYDSNLTTEEVVKRIKYIPQAFEFRDGFGYSNVMYVTAGAVIQKITGKTWGEVVQERILDPLGMDRTIYLLDDLDKKGNWAIPHATINGKNIKIRYENWEQVGATGGLISSVEDLSKWMSFNMNNGIVGTDTLFTAHSRNMIWTGWNPFVADMTSKDPLDADFSAYGLGFGISEYKGKLRVSHTGGFGGMLSSFYMLPDENIGVILLTNDTESPLQAVPYYIFDQYLGLEEVDYATIHYENMLRSKKRDTRIQEIKDARVKGTSSSKPIQEYATSFYSDLYGGTIDVRYETDGQLHLYFEHQPHLSATLTHWHYDTFQVNWDEIQPWFGFGVITFEMNAKREITGLAFDIPNNDFFFEELAPYVK